MGSASKLPELKRDKPSGAWRGRKVIPAPLRAAYQAQYGVKGEPIFWRRPSYPPQQAKAEWAEWLSLIERRIAALREAGGGKGIDLTQREADALAGDWYRWFTSQHLDHPGKPKRWEGLRGLFLQLLDDDEEDALDRLDHEARTIQFLLDRGVALSPFAATSAGFFRDKSFAATSAGFSQDRTFAARSAGFSPDGSGATGMNSFIAMVERRAVIPVRP